MSVVKVVVTSPAGVKQVLEAQAAIVPYAMLALLGDQSSLLP